MAQKKLAISMRGGGARCAGYLGLLKLLKEHEIEVDLIIGSSGGASFGATYAYTQSIPQVVEYVNDFSVPKLTDFKTVLLGKSLFSEEHLTNYLNKIVPPNIDLSDLTTKTIIQATSLKTGNSVAFSKGNLHKLILASGAIPFIFPVITINNEEFIDGDFSSGFGANIARNNGAEVVIGLNASKPSPADANKFVDRVISAYSASVANVLRKDLQVNPVDLLIPGFGESRKGLLDFSNNLECVEQGYEISKQFLPYIKKLIFKRKLFFFRP